jgi:hypothetical protein
VPTQSVACHYRLMMMTRQFLSMQVINYKNRHIYVTSPGLVCNFYTGLQFYGAKRIHLHGLSYCTVRHTRGSQKIRVLVLLPPNNFGFFYKLLKTRIKIILDKRNEREGDYVEK